MQKLLADVPIDTTFFDPARTSRIFQQPGELISALLPNILIGASVVLFFLMMGGAFMMLAGAGNDDAKQAAQGKVAVTSAITGFLLVVSAYFILQILEVVTGINFLKTGQLLIN
jgi:hypothetical protein